MIYPITPLNYLENTEKQSLKLQNSMLIIILQSNKEILNFSEHLQLHPWSTLIEMNVLTVKKNKKVKKNVKIVYIYIYIYIYIYYFKMKLFWKC